MEKVNKYLFLSIISIFCVVILSLLIGNNKNKIENINETIKEVKEQEGYNLLYIGAEDCEACSYQLPQIEAIIKTYDFPMYYIDLNNLSDNKVSDIVNDLGIKTTEFVTPSLVIYKDGELEDMVSGFQTPDMLFDFLQKNSIISAEANMYINYLDLDKYKEIIQSEVPQIIALGSYSSEESNTTQVELWKVAKENNIKINYLSLSTLTEEEGADFESTLSFFSENEVGIPMIIVVKNGEVIASSLETFDTEGYINFFKENGLM